MYILTISVAINFLIQDFITFQYALLLLATCTVSDFPFRVTEKHLPLLCPHLKSQVPHDLCMYWKSQNRLQSPLLLPRGYFSAEIHTLLYTITARVENFGQKFWNFFIFFDKCSPTCVLASFLHPVYHGWNWFTNSCPSTYKNKWNPKKGTKKIFFFKFF